LPASLGAQRTHGFDLSFYLAVARFDVVCMLAIDPCQAASLLAKAGGAVFQHNAFFLQQLEATLADPGPPSDPYSRSPTPSLCILRSSSSTSVWNPLQVQRHE